MIDKMEIVARIQKLPTIPGAVVRLSALAQSDKASAKDFEEIIKPDPSMTANLLRLANSPFFGLRRQVTSVRQAVTLLGVSRVCDIATSAALARTMPKTIPGYGIDARSFWIHCMAVAGISERLAVEVQVTKPSLTFTAGLLHDVGKLVVGSYLLDEAKRVIHQLRSEESTLIEAERTSLGTDHAEIGAMICDLWDLPEAVGAAAKMHHEPSRATSENHSLLIDLVHTADCLAHSLGFGTDVGELARRFDSHVTERLGIKIRRLEHAASESIEQIHSMGTLFDTP